MGINILDKTVSELIAAGEVIERPASIVKELVENSIDANSTAITVEIRRGGISYIRVTDNGSGIEKDDIRKAFLRHATSKVLVADDLDNINTLGFRGEALASITAVSRIEATSKMRESDFGYCLSLEGDIETSFEQVGCPDGTSIIVKDLFYNVPARLKFLKKDVTEGNVIAGIIDKLALSHPKISFKFINDFKTKLLTPGNGELLSVIHTVFGKEFATALVPVNYEYNEIKVSGYTSRAGSSRSNRSMQHFFVNTRYVKSKTCAVAIEEGYKNQVMTGKYPFCVINVDILPSEVDVNVHPAKIEVRFTNERAVFDAIYFAIKSAMTKNDELSNINIPHKKPVSLSTFKNDNSEQQELPVHKTTGQPVDYTSLNHVAKSLDIRDKGDNYQAKPVNDPQYNYITSESLKKPTQTKAVPVIKLEQPLVNEQGADIPQKKQKVFVKIIGELFKTYVLFEAGDNFIMLDKHAAHERILYDKLKKSVVTDQRQILIKPITVCVSTDEFIALTTHLDTIIKMGFSIEEFGNNTIVIREAPLILVKYNLEDVLLDIATKLSELKRDISSDIFEGLLHSIACRSAVKANDFTGEDELEQLVYQVLEDDSVRHCPHGRPIVSIFKRNEIEKRFGRIQ